MTDSTGRSLASHRRAHAVEDRTAQQIEQMQRMTEKHLAWAREQEGELVALRRLLTEVRTHVDHGDPERAVKALDESGDPMWELMNAILRPRRST